MIMMIGQRCLHNTDWHFTPPGRILLSQSPCIASISSLPLQYLSDYSIIVSHRLCATMSAKPVSQDPELELDDDQYDSEADEDFKLDGQDDEALSSDSDEEASKKRKAETEDAALDSGDEVTIKKAKSRKEKKRKGNKSKTKGDDEDDLDLDDDEGGPGGFVRTRAMKMQM